MKSILSLLFVTITMVFLAVPQTSEASWWKFKKKSEPTKTEQPCSK